MITLKGQPISTQHCYRFVQGSMYMKGQCATLKEDYQWQAKEQWQHEPTEMPLALSVNIFFGDRRKRDIDNFNKLWMDALEGIVYKNDTQINELHLHTFYDKENPRIEVRIV